ncbi:MAG: hypothetical protein HGA53_04490 [Anaerolineaceae bacterium]|nr:hypothetical protein [Anaerolineaceae bacterium]
MKDKKYISLLTQKNLVNFAMILALVFGLLITTPARPVEAAVIDYYVSTSGSDSNVGTLPTKPFRKIQTAVNKVTAGGTIYIMGGTYNESLKFSNSGTSTAPIKLTRYNSTAVTINGGSSPALVLSNAAAKYWIVQGLRLTSTGTLTISYTAWGCSGSCGGVDHWSFLSNYISGAVKIYGAYTLFEGNEVDGRYNKGNNGNAVQDMYPASHHNIFRSNTIHDFPNRGLWSMNRTHDNIFEKNTIYNITSSSGRCINLDAYGTVEYRHTVRNNHLYKCYAGAIELENTYASIVENNILHDNYKQSISIILYGKTITSPGTIKCTVGGENNQYGDTNGDNSCEGDISQNIIRNNLIYNGGASGGIVIKHAGGVKIYGNTIHNQAGPGVLLDSTATYCPQIELVNNIFSQNTNAEVSLLDYKSITKDNNNLFYPKSSSKVYVSRSTWAYLTLQAYQSTYAKGYGSLVANPLFVSTTSSNFRLQTTSPAIDKGVSIGVSYDIQGTTRPLGAANDIGAYEIK